jgi:hypothetical protein
MVSITEIIGMVVAPIPISLPLPLGCAIPIDVGTMPPLPIYMPGALFTRIKIVVVAVMSVIDVVTIIMVIVSIPIVILCEQVRRREQRHTQR